MLAKRKRIHLTGKKARKLHDDCFERDGHVCVCCGTTQEMKVQQCVTPAYRTCVDCTAKRGRQGNEKTMHLLW